MNRKKKLKGAETFGVRVIKDKSLDKFSGKVLCPEMLERANTILQNVEWPEGFFR